MNIVMPESMMASIDNLSKSKNCSSNTIVKLAVARFLFDQTLPIPEVYENKFKQLEAVSNDIIKEIPLDKIVSVQYTLDDGRVIHVKRQSKMR